MLPSSSKPSAEGRSFADLSLWLISLLDKQSSSLWYSLLFSEFETWTLDRCLNSGDGFPLELSRFGALSHEIAIESCSVKAFHSDGVSIERKTNTQVM